jgi:hypothetical protein
MTITTRLALLMVTLITFAPAFAQETISIQATDASAAEPSNNGTFTVSLSAPNTTGGDLTVSYGVGGTASPGDDYTALSGSVVVANNASSATIPVNVTNDSLVEGAETVVVTLTGSSDAGFVVDGASDTDTITISDDDGGQISVNATDADAGEPSNDGTFTVNLSATNNTGSAITVTYNVTGTATNGADYQNLGGSVQVSNGSSSAQIPVNVTNDNTGRAAHRSRST